MRHRHPSNRVFATALVLTLAACVGAEPTGVELTVELAEPMDLDRLRVNGAIGSTVAFQPGLVPEEPRAIQDGEVALLLVPDELDGTTLLLTVEGLRGTTTVAHGTVDAPITMARITPVTVRLAPPASGEPEPDPRPDPDGGGPGGGDGPGNDEGSKNDKDKGKGNDKDKGKNDDADDDDDD